MVELSRILSTLERYPWFAPAIVDLCTATAGKSGGEAALDLFRSNSIYFPDIVHVYSALCAENAAAADYTDKSIVPQQRVPSRSKAAGMDYFSREDYDSVCVESDALLKKIGIVDYSKPYEEHRDDEDPQCGLITETLARVYAEQGYPDQAIEIYRKLSLQNPEKSAYFVSLIDKLKNQKI